ncbi:MAG: copper-translocating P-type ATPase [Acidimicrobiales bacterium]
MHHHAEMFRRRFWWSLVLAVPVAVCSRQFQDWFGYTLPEVLSVWVPPVFGTVLYVWGGQPFLSGAVSEARARQPGMMSLVALGITVAFVSSLAGSLGFGNFDFWWELVGLIVIMLLGHWQEMRAIGQAQGALAALAAILPDTAEVLDGSRTTTVPLDQVGPGDVVLVRPGGRVPADGTVVDGSAAVDESMITGESVPVTRSRGDQVVGGTVATDSALRVRISAVGDDTALAGIQRLVAEAQASSSRTQALADRAAGVLFYVATGVAVVTFVVWAALGETDQAISRTISVLVVACPHALGLAIPLVVSISTTVGARNGILVKSRLALERMREVDTVLFDKTGTLTMGNHVVVDRAATAGWDPADVLRLAAGAEMESEHPAARAIVSAAGGGTGVGSPGPVPSAEGFTALPGRGVRATVEGTTVEVGGPALLRHQDLTEPDDLASRTGRWRDEGGSVLDVVVDGGVVGAVTLADRVRPESEAAVAALHRRDVEVVMITGDARPVAERVARELGIARVLAEVLPADKSSRVGELQAGRRRVAMVGDGVNDAPALAQADVGLAIGAGTDVAVESAGVVLASSDPRSVVGVIELSKATYVKMIQNLAWATAYNAVAIPVAAGVFAFAGVSMPPAVAAIAMTLSTIVVAVNAQLLRRIDLSPDHVAPPV